MRVPLKIHQNSAFISPQTEDEDQRRRELRARTVLAFGYSQGYLHYDVTEVNKREIIVGLSTSGVNIPGFIIKHEVGSGEIEIADSLSVGWSEQPIFMLMYLDRSANIDLILSRYFQVPLRWLDDQKGAQSALQRVFENLGLTRE